MDNETSRFTPIDDDYQSCERTDVTLRIYFGELDPKEITNLLGIEPTETQKKGEIRWNSLGRQRIGKIGGWFLSSENRVQSKDLRRHLDWLLDRIEPSKDKLEILQRMPGIKMAVNCIWWSAAGGGGPTLWPEQMRRLADLNLECSFDISFYGDEEE